MFSDVVSAVFAVCGLVGISASSSTFLSELYPFHFLVISVVGKL